MDEIKYVAKLFRGIYESEMGKLEIPFFSSFPKNCCEGASFFFAFYIMQIFPDRTVEIVKGMCDSGGDIEYHIWVEVDGYIFDLTADQFEGIEKPIYSKTEHPLMKEFRPQTRDFVSCYFLYYIDKVLEIEKVNEVNRRLLEKVLSCE